MTLSIQQLAFMRNNEFLFDNLNYILAAGALLQVRGINGCGKSTLLRILAGFIQPETGEILWNGQNIFQQLDHYNSQISYLGHQNGIKPYLTAYENLKLSCAVMDKKISSEKLITVLGGMNLEHVSHTQAIHLSAGQKRRLALCRLQLTAASLWILDEPTTALDQTGQDLLANSLDQHAANGGIAIIATHHDLKVNSIKTLELAYV